MPWLTKYILLDGVWARCISARMMAADHGFLCSRASLSLLALDKELSLEPHSRLAIQHFDRYTSPGDFVICTAREREDITNAILGSGRMHAAFLADEIKV